ncbi:hypothetical protein JW848_05375 [Candidatus Bipolaricaulota bacterium]|nr:hypothetical protein [Candidatus Bipolaricaulota bacterium]
MTNRKLARRMAWVGLVLSLLIALSGCADLFPTAGEEGALGAGQALAPMAKHTTWRVPGDFATLQEAIDSPTVVDGDRILVEPGSHAGAYVDKSVEIRGEGGAAISDGPLHPAGLVMGFRMLAGSDGASISHLTFEVDLGIMNGDAVDGVFVSHCTFLNTLQAVSNWRGCGWEISHNVIEGLRTRNGGGIGILIGDFAGGVVTGNTVAYNTVRGVLAVDPDDGGGYNGSGIVLYADFRWGGAGASEISGNRVLHNTISLISDTPDVVDVAALELTDTRDDPELNPVIVDNAVGFNDFRGTAIQIALTPEELADCNEISRNLGDNRGRGAHPSAFGPGE